MSRTPSLGALDVVWSNYRANCEDNGHTSGATVSLTLEGLHWRNSIVEIHRIH